MMRARTTLKTLAQHLGLSITTVSRALKDGPEVKPGTRARVKAAALELGYRPNQSGIGLKTGKTHVIAVILPVQAPDEVVGDVGTGPLIAGLTAALDDTPYQLTVIPSRPEQDELAPVRLVVEQGLADGVVLTLTQSQDARVRYLADVGLPFVTFGRTELALPHPYVDIDNADFTQRAVEHLLNRGRERLCLLLPPERFLFAWHQRVGFMRAHQARGLSVEPQRQLISDTANFDPRDFARQQALSDTAPDAYICGDEITAMGLLAGLSDAGHPADVVALETSALADYFHQPVDGFRQDLHHAGRQLGRVLLAALSGDVPIDELQVIDTACFINRTDPTTR
ncbi:LacI family transcriptional regulator [Saccharospirillum mangrovi]|uniref:LacI family transcriptional regulator n=1 Tax=Saccharospirillum mangrovi TaxID=2161747 RepID=UPI000D3A70D1|nr:LacI family transcriptional regulator [Saccharospirillum mangrovi]